MEKKISNKEQEIKKSNFEQRKKSNSIKSAQINDKRLPWWVELLFVQIGFPDKWLIKILKTKKQVIDIYKDEKRIIFFVLLFIVTMAYFQPTIKYSKNKLKCQKIASNYILNETNLNKQNLKKVKMLAVNLCDGGNEIEKFVEE